jgi:nitric oxide reductase NorD protein
VISPVTQERCPAHVCFADIHRLLALFAQGLAGRYLHLKLLEPEDAPRRNARMTDEAAIFLPAQIGSFATAQHNLGAYRIAVLHQIGGWEGTADFDLQQFFAESSRPVLLRRIFFAVEDLRIDTAMPRRYPGARADLARVLAHALANRPPISSMPSLTALIEAMVQFSLGAPRAALMAGDESGLLEGLLDAAAAVQCIDADVHDSARASLAICAQLEKLSWENDGQLPAPSLAKATAATDVKPEGEFEPNRNDLDDPAHGAALGLEFRGDTTSDKAVWRRSCRSFAASTRESPPLAGAMNEERSGGQQTLPVRSPVAAVLPLENTGPRSFLYDEWDFHRQAYLAAWCRVFEHRLRGEEFGFIEDVRRRHSTLAHHVRRQFGFIKPQSWRRVRRTSDGDELELDGLIEAVIDRRTGHASDSHLYVRRDRALRDVAAAFLVDMSASTDFELPGSAAVTKSAGAATQAVQSGLYLYGGHDDMPDPVFAPKRRVIDVSKDALALMCDALQALGDSYAIYGFSGDGRDNVEFHVAKDFADKLSLRTWGALAAMQPRRSTRMGAAIRHALSKLARETAGIKVLIIVSDGYPEDHDYGTDRTDREYGIQDTARALWEVERAGVTDFCVTIDPAGHDYLRRMCKETRYLVIDDVTALPHELTKIYRTLTAR